MAIGARLRHARLVKGLLIKDLARDAQGSFGVAIASRFFAVGALCVHDPRQC